MAAAKYKKFYELMTDENSSLFDRFQVIHDGYKADRKNWSKDFHLVGQEVVDIMRSWERRLCAGMERGQNAVYSQKLAEKFWNEIKKRYSHIELVGIKSNFD
jgi:hypothetical protein